VKTVTVRRSGARGDVLLATALLPALKEKYDEVFFSTRTENILLLLGHPSLTGVLSVNDVRGDLIDLDDVYEKTPLTHIVSAYAKAAGIAESDTAQPFLNDVRSMAAVYDVVIHPTVSWPSRTLPVIFWQRLAWAAVDAGLRVAVVRARSEPKLSGDIDEYVDLMPKGVAGLIASSRVFIGADSLPMHLAATTQTPIVGLFTVALPKYRYPWKRDERLFRGITADVECVGCLHREAPPVRFTECRLDAGLKNRCVSAFDVNEVFCVAKEFLT